ncbi:TPA: thioredoxin [Patescibacteria group bacterium]|nr:thioredoxin [Patescibacteria group bacterium]
METILTDTSFKEETASGLVLVDFWAPWCAPCIMLGPIIEEVGSEVKDIKIGKLNVDENPQTAQAFQIMSIPAIMLFKDGEHVETLIGLRPKEDYLAMIEKNR